MARFVDNIHLDCCPPQTSEHTRAWNHSAWVFGRKPSSIRSISPTGNAPDACVVKLGWEPDDDFEFICAGGVLIGIPPKRGK